MGKLDGQAAEHVTRPAIAELDEILGQPLPVLDDGFVRVVDYLGCDAAVVQAARVSYGTGTRQVHEDRGLLRYLMRHRHSTPFEMCELKLHVRVPMDCWRQWIRHRTANVNEYSTRYSMAVDAAYQTSAEQWRLQTSDNRQGSAGVLDAAAGALLSEQELEFQARAREVYQGRLSQGVARELARKDLPLSTYTEAYWKIDLHNLLHFLALRMDSHAQLEIRSYARTIGYEIVRRWCPLTWEAFVDYRLERLELTRLELEVLRALNEGGGAAASARASELGLLQRDSAGSYKRNRERAELEQKLLQLGLQIPWRD
ncbi:MAG: FAD-dependent thymidylate synthase [Proteobacteria bacterium]|nr:FAD-dependent thymidylate synthase [Pseudomonadota bacterium]